MPREIKFRGKRRDGKGWLYGNYITYDEDSNLHVFINPPGCYTDNDDHLVFPDTVGQFTGLQDKNGKEIYEGDIIESQNYSHARHYVRYIDDEAKFVAMIISHGSPLMDFCSIRQSWIDKYDKKVIGNIHDNPEMLNTSE